MKSHLLFVIFFSFFPLTHFAQTGCWKEISSGYTHTIAIRNDGTLWAWGQNTSGELGDGTMDFKLSPVKIGQDTDWEKVETGGSSSFAIKTDGTLWCWGSNSMNHQGIGPIAGYNTPTQVGTDTNWKQVSCGYIHTIGLKTDGSIWSCGSNIYGTLGTGPGSPTPGYFLQIGSQYDWTSVYAGKDASYATKANGETWAWGANYVLELGSATPSQTQNTPILFAVGGTWKQVISSHNFAIALKSDGSLWSTGDNNFGQLGDGTFTSKSGFAQFSFTNDWEEIQVGYYNVYARKNDGSIWSWGRNDYGQLGDGTYTNQNSPIQIGTDLDWKTSAAGAYHCVAQKNNGAIWTWGSNDYGQLGTGTAASLMIVPDEVFCPESFSVDENYNNVEIVLYPNPATKSFNIQTEENIERVLIINQLGVTVKSVNDSSNIQVDDLPQGLYYVKMFTKKGVITVPIIKQ